MSEIKIYRLDLDEVDMQLLQEHINAIKGEESYTTFNELKEKVNNPKVINWSAKKSNSARTATMARTQKAKEKIQNAINILRMENKKLTHYSIAKQAEVSYLTVKKYISLDEIN